MNCTHSDHQGKKIESICLNSECDFNYFCCKKCEKEFHKSHTDDCFDLEDDFDQKFQKMVSTQNSLIKKLQSLVDTISVKSGKHIKQLEYDLNTLKQFGPLIKDLEVGQIAKHILIVKHLNSLQSEGDKLTQMESLLKIINFFIKNKQIRQFLGRIKQIFN